MSSVVVWICSHQEEHRGLLAKHPTLGILRGRNLRINLLRPPRGIAPRAYVNSFTQGFAKDSNLYQPSENFLKTNMLTLMDAYGVFHRGNGIGSDETVYPSLLDLRDFLEDIRGKMGGVGKDYHTAVLNRVQGLIDSTGDIFDCEVGFVDDLMSRSVLFEFGEFSAAHELILVGAMINRVFYWRQKCIAEGKGESLPHMLIVMDEIQNMVAKSNEGLEGLGRNPLEEILAKCRKLKMSVMVIDQRPSAVANYVRALCVNKVVGRLEDWHDIRSVASGLGLSRDQCLELTEFCPGTAIVKTDNFPQAVKVELDPFDGPLTVDPALVESRELELLRCLHFRERVPWERVKMELQTQALDARKSREIEADAKFYVIDVVALPLMPVQGRAARQAIGASAEQRRRYLAMEAELIRCFKFDQERGSSLILAEPTEKGLGIAGVSLKDFPGDGGLLHRAFQKALKEAHDLMGHMADIEKTLNGIRADLGVFINGKWVAIEVALSGEYQIKDIAHDLKAGFSSVRVLCRTRKTMQNIMESAKQSLTEAALDKVEFHLLWPYLQEARSESVSEGQNVTESELDRRDEPNKEAP